MNRTIGTIGGFFLAAGLGSGLDPGMVLGGVNAAAILFSSAALGFVIGAIADRGGS